MIGRVAITPAAKASLRGHPFRGDFFEKVPEGGDTGYERTELEFRALFEGAGLRSQRIVSTPPLIIMVEVAVP